MMRIRQIRGKIDIAFDDIGEQTLKNIAEPMRAWQIRLASEAAPAVRSSPPPIRVQDLALPDKPSIVVLPFDNMSAEAGSGLPGRWNRRGDYRSAFMHPLLFRHRT